ncbi:hypothetical protein Q1695_015739 [Nippostrongylus brasiliensis]|nr:hypothetical protein Q1695_015739 [Nippostrongylus brasiliensis]
MDVLKITLQIGFLMVNICLALCGKKQARKKGNGPPSSSESSSGRPAGDADIKLMPAQLRQIMEAEQMAKSNQGYDSFDVDVDEFGQLKKKKK